MKKVTAVILSLVMMLVLSACGGSGYDPSEDYTEITWPSSELVSLLPVPEALMGEINSESDDYFSVDLGATMEQYNAYVTACQEAGFTVDYYKSSSSFWAYNAEGYYVRVYYSESWSEMSITISVPEEEEETQADAVTTTTTEKKTTTTTAAKSDLDPDFKAAMDSYEKFMDDYISFMKKYQANPTSLSLIAQYATMMKDYSKMTSEFAKWEDEDLNDAEMDYYIEVMNRVNKKLLEIAE